MKRPKASRSFFLDSTAAVAIKIVGAALAYAMMISVAAVTSTVEFGTFGTAWAAVIIFSMIGLFGQQSVVMRFWPAFLGTQQFAKANGIMIWSAKKAGSGLVFCAVLAFFAGCSFGLFPTASPYVLLAVSTALFSIAFGWSEFISGALRARGLIGIALAPRDIIWRVLVMGAALALWLTGQSTSALVMLSGAGLSLAVISLFQTVYLARIIRSEGATRPTLSERAAALSTSWGLWGVNALPIVSSQVNTVLVALMLGPIWAGFFFAAERTTQLVILVTNGINQVLAPKVASAFAAGQIAHIQRLSSLSAIASSIAGMFVFALLAVAGTQIMQLFDTSYSGEERITALLILAMGQLLTAVAGPTHALLQMTGHERGFLTILGLSSTIGIALMILLTWQIGLVGAAVGATSSSLILNIAATVYSRRRVGVDPSLIGVFFAPSAPVEGAPT